MFCSKYLCLIEAGLKVAIFMISKYFYEQQKL